MPRTFIARTASEIERVRGLWHELYRHGRHSFFQSFEWNLLAARVFGAREAPAVITVESSHAAAIVPACIWERGVSLLGDSLFDYRDLLTSGDGGLSTHGWGALADSRLPVEVTALQGRQARDRWQQTGFHVKPFANAPCVRRADVDAEGFAHRHNRSARLLRRLARLGVGFHKYSGGESALVRTIYEAKAQQAVDTGENLFADPLRREFLVAAAAMSECDVFTLESAGTLVAALLTFRDRLVRRFYTTYYAHAWSHYSPGIALLFEVTRRSLGDGFDCDYMTGEQPHKLRFATSSVPLYLASACATTLGQIVSRVGSVAA